MNEKVHTSDTSFSKGQTEPTSKLPRREQEVLDLVYRLGRSSVRDIRDALPDDPTYSATRMLLQRLHKKGLLDVEAEGPKYLYRPVQEKSSAGKVALNRLLETFFNDSPAQAFSAMIADESIDANELAELEALIQKAKQSVRQTP